MCVNIAATAGDGTTPDAPGGDLIPLAEAARLIPGRKIHVNTLTRWRMNGVRGVRLRSCRVGGRIYTSRQWLAEFLAALNGEKPPPVEREDLAARCREKGV